MRKLSPLLIGIDAMYLAPKASAAAVLAHQCEISAAPVTCSDSALSNSDNKSTTSSDAIVDSVSHSLSTLSTSVDRTDIFSPLDTARFPRTSSSVLPFIDDMDLSTKSAEHSLASSVHTPVSSKSYLLQEDSAQFVSDLGLDSDALTLGSLSCEPSSSTGRSTSLQDSPMPTTSNSASPMAPSVAQGILSSPPSSVSQPHLRYKGPYASSVLLLAELSQLVSPIDMFRYVF